MKTSIFKKCNPWTRGSWNVSDGTPGSWNVSDGTPGSWNASIRDPAPGMLVTGPSPAQYIFMHIKKLNNMLMSIDYNRHGPGTEI
jgi:hypothetical protein